MIKRLRTRKKLTTGQAAELFGVSRRTWQRWEADERSLSVARFEEIVAKLKAI
jgi:transcriptional regulator with XRE-family HTH domain